MTFPKGLFEQQKRAVMITRQDDAPTSFKAAEDKVASGTIETDHEKILAVLSKRQDYAEGVVGWCAKEIASELNAG